MTETILRINETTFKKDKNSWESYDGFEIVTDNQSIKLGITNGQSCCESWGYFMTNDSLDEFIGAEILDVKVVDDSLNVETLKKEQLYDDACIMFVNIETNKGTLQFTAYNQHNGYYGHDAIVISDQLNHSECL